MAATISHEAAVAFWSGATPAAMAGMAHGTYAPQPRIAATCARARNPRALANGAR